MLAVLLEANASFHERTRKNVSLLMFRTKSVQENRKIKKKINLRIENDKTPQISTLIASQEKKQPRNEILNRQDLI